MILLENLNKKISILYRFFSKSIVYICAILFILIHGILLIKVGLPYLLLIPPLLLAFFIAFIRFDNFVLLIIFLVPISIPLYALYDGLSVNLSLPAEPLIIMVFVIFLIKIIKSESIDYKIIIHPVSIAIYINLIWIFITCVTSTMPTVSFKFLASRLWFIIAFYFVTAELCKDHSFLKKYLWAYIISLVLVVFYAMYRHTSIGLFDQQASHYVMGPFFSDHTSYGAIIAFILPVISGFIIDKNNNRTKRIFSFFLLIIFTIALTLSYSRAAWISLIFPIGVLVIVVLRVKFWIIAIIGIIIFYLALSNITEIIFSMGRNTKDSSASLTEHVQSISNITNDYSNVERLNRWNCAIRMFKEKPLFGWGPGTYMFKYAPFQVSYEKTPISTEAGDRGNAHSEYLGPLSESGFIGSLSFIAVVILTLITGFRVYKKVNTKALRILILSLLLGLITYYTHGVLNNFLDTDKASALFWGFAAMLVAIDISHKKKNE